jgi:hypothetical protein
MNTQHQRVQKAISKLLGSFTELAHRESCSYEELMKIVSMFLCANLAPRRRQKISVGRYSPKSGLSIDNELLQVFYPNSYITLYEYAGKSLLGNGEFKINFYFENIKYELNYDFFGSYGRDYWAFTISKRDVEVFYAELIHRDGKSFFEIEKIEIQDSYFTHTPRLIDTLTTTNIDVVSDEHLSFIEQLPISGIGKLKLVRSLYQDPVFRKYLTDLFDQRLSSSI